MITEQRLRSDVSTIDKREMADKNLTYNRNKNDVLTFNRRYRKDKGSRAGKTLRNNRNKNDVLTAVKRFKADKNTFENRGRNDNLTTHRREIKDDNSNMALVLFFAVLAVAAFFIFI